MITKSIPPLVRSLVTLFLAVQPLAAQEPPLNKDLPRPKPEAAWKSLGDSLWFDPARRELVILAQVVLRDGPLEHLLCLRGTKEHEAILTTSAEARAIHAGLLLTKAEPGHPVRFEPKFESPTGSAIKIQLVRFHRRQKLDQEPQNREAHYNRLGLWRQHDCHRSPHQEAILCGDGRRLFYGSQFRIGHPRPARAQLLLRRRPPIRRLHPKHRPPGHLGLYATFAEINQVNYQPN